jgi:hypothetical protein
MHSVSRSRCISGHHFASPPLACGEIDKVLSDSPWARAKTVRVGGGAAEWERDLKAVAVVSKW